MDSNSFSPQDSDAIFGLAERLTGNSQRGNLILSNVARRLEITGCGSLFEYLRYVEGKSEELPYLISGLVIHTTSFFREEPHFARFREFLEENVARFKTRPVRVLSAACSTGEEVYSFGLVLEEFRERNPGFEYQIDGRDIDVLCTQKGQKAVYPIEEIEKIPSEYRHLVLRGSGKTNGLFTVAEEIRRRVKFSTWNLVKLGPEIEREPQVDFLLCRNVLIYFTPSVVSKVVGNLLKMVHPEGLLCLGHSESVDPKRFGLELKGNSIFRRPPAGAAEQAEIAPSAKRRVLVIDDSAPVRKIIKRLLEDSEMVPVLASSGPEATEILKHTKVDLITLDLHMPVQNGVDWLAEQRKAGMRVPVVIISDDYPSEAHDTFGALENGAQDYFHKGQILTSREELLARFRELMRSAESKAMPSEAGEDDHVVNTTRLKLRRPDLILIGASIGGPEALPRLIRQLPADCPPVAIVQHISVNFARAFAEHMANVSGLKLAPMIHGLALEKGHLYMADGDFHIGVRRRGDRYHLIVSPTAPVKRHRPSVDFLFQSVDNPNCERVWAAILTGMGMDGAEGLLQLKQAGAMTFAQDARSCVVFGMAKEAVRLGAVNYIGTLPDLRRHLDTALMLPEGPSGGTSPGGSGVEEPAGSLAKT